MSLILLLLAFSTTTFADDSPGFGANVGSESSAFSLGNYNLFTEDQKYYGFYRYGGGGGRLQVGQGVGLSISSTGGIMAHQTEHTVLGLEVFDGTIVVNSNRGVESQYTYTPGVSAMGRLGPATVGPKVGVYVGNLGGGGMTPNVDYQYGAQAYIQLGPVKAEGIYTKIGSDLYLGSAEALFDKFIVKYENYQGLRQEINYILMLKVGNL